MSVILQFAVLCLTIRLCRALVFFSIPFLLIFPSLILQGITLKFNAVKFLRANSSLSSTQWGIKISFSTLEKGSIIVSCLNSFCITIRNEWHGALVKCIPAILVSILKIPEMELHPKHTHKRPPTPPKKKEKEKENLVLSFCRQGGLFD